MINDETMDLYSNLYSRQIGTYGLNTMKELSKLNVFIYGMRGLGAEISKNILLAGPKRVTIYDNNKTKIKDLTANFCVNENDVIKGKRLDEASYDYLSELNPHVKLNIMKEESIIEHLKKQLKLISEGEKIVVVISEFMQKKKIIELDQFCRKNKIGFIYGAVLGINTFCFVDFGDEFTVIEKNKESNKKYTIKSISKGNPGIVNVLETISGIDLENDDYVIFKEIEGMTELNKGSPIKIKVIDKNNVEILDTTNFSEYTFGGIMTKYEEPEKINFRPFEKRLEEPYSQEEGFPIELDNDKPNTNEIIHIGILGLYKFYEKYNMLPELNNYKHADELIEISRKILNEKESKKEFWIDGVRNEFENFDELFEKTIKELSLWSRAEISPITSFLGGIMAQEIVKFTGKYIPINQWLRCNFCEILEELNINSGVDRTLKGSRYDDQIAIFGNEIQKKLENTNIFMIGSGALGCEFLKSFSLMGIATDKKKKYNVTVTDNDNIIESNLNRQFLFRNENIGESKSKVASKNVLKINPSFNCIDKQARIGPENENIFNDKFWQKQNFIINAVDNVEARKYIANKSKFYKKILIDSGTNGVKANSQVIIPYKTIDYETHQKNNVEQIPMCTLRNFPSTIEHCIEWARDNFDGYFVNVINEIRSSIEDRNNFFNEISKNCVPSDQINKIKKIFRYINIILNKDYKECIKIALEEYNEAYNLNIIRILNNNPPDSLNEDGTRFWSGNKRCPHPLPFDIDNEFAFLFVESYAKILANSMSIPIIDNNEQKKKIMKDINSKLVCHESELMPKEKMRKYYNYYEKNSNISSEEEKQLKIERKKEIMKRLKIDQEKLNEIKKEFQNNFLDIQKEKIILINQEFEKDDDKNGHIDFIYAASNLRAEIFKIEKCDKIKAKLIAGKITPAIASTTAAIVGLVSLQLYTLNQTTNINCLRNSYINLALSSISFCCPSNYDETNEESANIIHKRNSIWSLFREKIIKLSKFI